MTTEKRLIDANALDGVLKDFENRYQKEFFVLSAKAIANARQIVYAMKTVDAVEVVRCCDCNYCDVYQKEADYETMLICMIHSFEVVDPTDFCSRGERKDNG